MSRIFLRVMFYLPKLVSNLVFISPFSSHNLQVLSYSSVFISSVENVCFQALSVIQRFWLLCTFFSPFGRIEHPVFSFTSLIICGLGNWLRHQAPCLVLRVVLCCHLQAIWTICQVELIIMRNSIAGIVLEHVEVPPYGCCGLLDTNFVA